MIVELKELHKSFGEKKVLKGISIRAEGGKAFGLLGRNGAGKTTTIRILMNVLPADAGEVLLDGEPIDYQKIGLGYLPEERGLYPKKKILDQLVYFAELKGMARKDAVKAVDYWLERLDMMEYRNKRLDTLSKGNQQKIQLVTALAHNPDIVILDEPFSGLDPVNALLLKDVVREEISKGKIVIFSSHQMSQIEEFCDTIAIMDQGDIVLSGDLIDIKRSYPRDVLEIRALDMDAMIEEIQREGFSSIQGIQKTGVDKAVVRLQSEGVKKTVMQKMSERYDLDEIKVYEPTLNDIFVEYTKEGAAGGSHEAV